MNTSSNPFEFIYSQNQDKQRIAIVGEQARTIFNMVKYVLNVYAKKADYVIGNQLVTIDQVKFTDAPVLVVTSNQPTEALLSLQFHALIVTKFDLLILNKLADHLPKSGMLICDDRDPVASIAKKDRADVLIISFKAYPHSTDREGVSLITSTNEKFPIKVKGEENLRCITAAKEIVKRIGVSSGQFYRAITEFDDSLI
jgi:hypothetical protein